MGGWEGLGQPNSSALYAASLPKECALTAGTMQPTGRSRFLFFFSFAGLPRTYEGSELRNAADTTNSKFLHSRKLHKNNSRPAWDPCHSMLTAGHQHTTNSCTQKNYIKTVAACLGPVSFYAYRWSSTRRKFLHSKKLYKNGSPRRKKKTGKINLCQNSFWQADLAFTTSGLTEIAPCFSIGFVSNKPLTQEEKECPASLNFP